MATMSAPQPLPERSHTVNSPNAQSEGQDTSAGSEHESAQQSAAAQEAPEEDPILASFRSMLAAFVLRPEEKLAEEGRRHLRELSDRDRGLFDMAFAALDAQLKTWPGIRRSLPDLLRRPYAALDPTERNVYTRIFQAVTTNLLFAADAPRFGLVPSEEVLKTAPERAALFRPAIILPQIANEELRQVARHDKESVAEILGEAIGLELYFRDVRARGGRLLVEIEGRVREVGELHDTTTRHQAGEHARDAAVK